MTREECIDGLQEIVEFDKNKILVRVHVGFLIHAIKFMKEQKAIVLCKNCKYYDPDTGICSKGYMHGYANTWFCADGEVKQDAAKG